MGLFGNKKERKVRKEEKKRQELEEHIKTRGLEYLPAEEKERVASLIDSIYDPYYRIRGSEVEIRQIELLSTIVEQNWMIIKMLNEINTKE